MAITLDPAPRGGGLRAVRPALHRARAALATAEPEAEEEPLRAVGLLSREASRGDFESDASTVDTADIGSEPSPGSVSSRESNDSLRAMLLASQRMNAALMRDLEAERARNRPSATESNEVPPESADAPPPEPASAPPPEPLEPKREPKSRGARASSARASASSSARSGFHALRRLSSSTGNTGTMPSLARSLSLTRNNSSSSDGGGSASARSAEARRPRAPRLTRRGSEPAALPPGGPAVPKAKPKRRTMIAPSKPLRAGVLLSSATAPGAWHGDAAELEPPEPPPPSTAAEAQGWPEPLLSPLKPTAAARGLWGDEAHGARGGGGGPAARPAAACFSRGLLSLVQDQLAQELTRLQEATQEVLEKSMLPAEEAGGEADDEARSALEERVRSLSRRLGWVRSDLGQLKPHVEANGEAARRDELPGLLELALAAEEFASSLRAELRTQQHARDERCYGELLLHANLAPQPVPKDGNCLFGCAARWAALRQAQADGVLDDATMAMSAGAPAEARAAAAGARLAAALEQQGLGSEAALATGGAAQRGAVVAALQEAVERGGGGPEREAVDTMLGEAQRGSMHDDTSVRLRAALEPVVLGGGELGTPEARAAYLQVMGEDGVFGARLELETLARLLEAPVHLYYRMPGQPPPELDPATRLPPPSEVIEPPGGSDGTAEPLRLLHMMSARHFDLLLPLV